MIRLINRIVFNFHFHDINLNGPMPITGAYIGGSLTDHLKLLKFQVSEV